MSLNGVNGQNLQTLYENLQKLNQGIQCENGECEFVFNNDNAEAVDSFTANGSTSTVCDENGNCSVTICENGECSVQETDIMTLIMSTVSEMINKMTGASSTENTAESSDTVKNTDNRVDNGDGTYTVTTTDEKTGAIFKRTYDANDRQISTVKTTDKGVVLSTSTFTYNDDGSYTQVTKSPSGATTTYKKDADGKILSATSKNAKGQTITHTYKYNDDGSYTRTAKNKTTGSTTVTKYGKDGKAISAVTTTKKGVKKTTTYKYNADGSRTQVTTNKKTGTKTTKKYDKYGRLTSSVSKYKKSMFSKGKTSSITRTYNDDGSYTEVKVDRKGKYKKATYTAEGKKILANGEVSKGLKVQTATSENYKDKIASEGTSYVIFGNPKGCSHCVSFGKKLNEVIDELTNVKSISSITVGTGNDSNSDNYKLMVKYMQKFGLTSGGYPFLVKFVDGKAVSIETNVDNWTEAQIVKKMNK